MSGRTKGVSYEEKRKRTMDFLMEKKDFYMLRELEKLLPKEKGIVSQSVKDIVQSLVDDRMISCEKVGISNFFFSFPSTAMKVRQAKLEGMQAEMAKLEALEAEMNRQRDDALIGREEGLKRREDLNLLSELESQRLLLLNELEGFREMDPDLFEMRKKEAVEAKAGCDRWTDNIYTLQSYCSNTFNLARTDFATQFEIPEDLDYVA